MGSCWGKLAATTRIICSPLNGESHKSPQKRKSEYPLPDLLSPFRVYSRSRFFTLSSKGGHGSGSPPREMGEILPLPPPRTGGGQKSWKSGSRALQFLLRRKKHRALLRLGVGYGWGLGGRWLGQKKGVCPKMEAALSKVVSSRRCRNSLIKMGPQTNRGNDRRGSRTETLGEEGQSKINPTRVVEFSKEGK